MEDKLLYTVIIFCICLSACSSISSFKGQLKPQGMTTYMYGTHKLVTKDTLFSLRSSALELTDFENQKVKVFGTPVEGYPIEGGPVLIEVEKIKVIGSNN